METIRICAGCGQPLLANAPEGLCPKCLAKIALGSEPAASPRIAPDPAQLAPHFPQLEIIELLGMGGMGMVYKARQPRLDRFVALKILPMESAPHPSFAERFNREAKALAKLSHPGIVNVYDFGQTSQYYYFVMEYVDGMNLRQLLQSESIAPRQALELVVQICAALQYAHDEGVVHRDIKPENILLNKKGQVKIADFGLAKLMGNTPDTALTVSQAAMGTLNYMAPEQRENAQKVDHRADIYSLGVVFYEMLTGEVPMGRFDAPSKKVQVDVRLDEIVLRALEREPSRRYQQASEVRTGVEAITSTATILPAPTPSTPPAPDAGSPPIEKFLTRATGLFFIGWLITKWLWNFRAPGFLLGCLGMAALLMWVSLKRMRLFPEQALLYSQLAPSTRRGALAMHFLCLAMGFYFLMSALLNFWEQDPMRRNPSARTAEQYEATYKGKEYHLLQGLEAFSHKIPTVEMTETSDYFAPFNGMYKLMPICPLAPGTGSFLACALLAFGCLALLLSPCGLIGEWQMYLSGMKFSSASWLFSLSVARRHARAGLAVAACALMTALPVGFFAEVKGEQVTVGNVSCYNTNIDAVTKIIETWAETNGYVVGDNLNWYLNTVPNGDHVGQARLREAWKPSPFDRWRSTPTTFHRLSSHFAFELVSSENPAQTRLSVTVTGDQNSLFLASLRSNLDQLPSLYSAPPAANASPIK